ncbi:GNAT family N-acetyltransferase [Paracoccus sp. 11-3]|uniref:GNAT family N-acetyltransferase n=1 Tax=Paracoccus amoyensis TaxID=2760093 RepID=A0A926JBN9_9RHOB|nr:GNAT family protein [Paracoccus amoyensis]MBC9245499.1 GNAT family N-acetyltransferase [Paracoccus amoyensis]
MTAARVLLDRPRSFDVQAITAAMSDWQVAQWLSAPPWPYLEQHARDYVAGVSDAEYAIRVDGMFAGTVRANGSFGIWVAPKYQGQDIACRASVLALTRKFRAGTSICHARYMIGNKRSAALLSSLGFQPVGQSRIRAEARGTEVDIVSMELTRTDFARLHGIRLTTPRLVIDAYQRADLPDLYRIVTLPQVAQMLLRFYPGMPLAEAENILATDALLPPIRLVARHQGKVVGSIGISDGQPPAIFYFLDPAAAGQGLAQEMAQAFMQEIKARFDPQEMVADVFAENIASQKILERIGFQPIAREMISSKARQSPAPGLMYRWQRDAV